MSPFTCSISSTVNVYVSDVPRFHVVPPSKLYSQFEPLNSSTKIILFASSPSNEKSATFLTVVSSYKFTIAIEANISYPSISILTYCPDTLSSNVIFLNSSSCAAFSSLPASIQSWPFSLIYT